ncbi:2-oxo acid dehydrogenase subunit E2 [Clostridium sp. 19966]|uniref:2-oxo acid dehydrogenase subunit E2 n=1 Tax=Clostridium sp. 19966 TaxID=2768166 RepID=UPI0028DD6981|nr:2-oxo acid dehydrogenase subunit E2 [Clostridium sp. 19966]MDT8716296.1 2-oxo acid dehydrogenase subunit E2 [Clostridium sp. 19966]
MNNNLQQSNKISIAKKLTSGINFRRDGILLRNIDPMRQILPYLFRSRNGSIVYSPEAVEFDNAKALIKNLNKEDSSLRVGTFEMVIAALVRTISQYPHLNRFVGGKKIYARKAISFSFVVLKIENGAQIETNSKVYFEKTDTIYEISKKINESIDLCLSDNSKNDDKLMAFVTKMPSVLTNLVTTSVRKMNDWGIIPMSLILTDPLYSTSYISNLGSIGHDALNHHLYEWGTTSLFVTMGKLNKINHLNADGSVSSKTILNLVVSVDERIADGVYLVKALKYFKSLLNKPEKLLTPPEYVVEDDGI